LMDEGRYPGLTPGATDMPPANAGSLNLHPRLPLC
jgi:hypothetical protein